MKKPSVAYRFRFLIVSFSALIMLITTCSILFYSRMKENEVEIIQRTNLLQSYITNFDSVVQQYHELSVEMSGTPTLRSFVLNNYNNPRRNTSDVMSLLAIAKSQHAYLENIWLYDVRTEVIVDDQYHYTDISESKNSFVTNSYLEGTSHLIKIIYNGYSTSVLLINDSIYVVRDFPVLGENRLGILFLKLDAASIVKNYLQSNELVDTYAVFDENGQLIKALSSADEAQVNAAKAMLEADVLRQTVNGKECIAVDSNLLGWRCCAFFHQQSSKSFQELPLLLLPVLILIGILSLLFSRFLFKLFIEPLEKIADSIRSTYDITDGNEFDAIYQSLTKSSNSIQELNMAIMDISPQMAENIFANLYDGIPMSMNYIRNALNILHIPFKLNGIYWTIVITFSDKTTQADQISALITKEIKAMSNIDMNYHINSYPNHTVVLIEMPNSNGISYFCNLVYNGIIRQLSTLPYSLKVGRGDLVYNFSNVHSSYVSAINNAKEITTDAYDETLPASSGSDSSMLNTAKQVKAFVAKLVKLVDENRLWQAKEDLSCQLDLIPKEDPDEFRTNCTMLITTLTEHERLAGIIADESEKELSDLLNFSPEMTIQEISGRVQLIGTTYLEALSDRNKKHSYQIVIASKKYIEQHFSDPEISLASVAEAIKTSPGYLSKMFKTYESTNFISYVNECRIRHACKMLAETDKPVKEILLSCGFLSEQNFFRVFKKITYMTPKQYRDAQKK